MMKRRDFLKTSAAVTGGSLLNELGIGKLVAQSSEVSGPRPNILFILVDELRFPTVFPKGIKDAGEFLHKFMPNLHCLWKRGVKFGNHHTAANACTPSRGVMITGLYSQQNWLISTILASPTPSPIARLQPVLNPAYPTYGKLLRRMGYHTPYFGKWHVSLPVAPPNGVGLQRYGFDYNTYPDPTGYNLQGTFGEEPDFHNDAYTASQAVQYLQNYSAQDSPFCLTVSLVNPHDREFFPAGTEFLTVREAYQSPTSNPNGLTQNTVYSDPTNPDSSGPNVDWNTNYLKDPPDYGYPDLPPNWESTADWQAQNKPPAQVFFRDLQELIFGGITEDSTQTDFTIAPYNVSNLGTVKAPFSYWRRGLDSYTQVMGVVDEQIGRVVDALQDLPKQVVENTVIIFCSDHGEYSGAHGLPQGKIGTVYEEAWHVPLIVVDPSGRFTGDIDDIRTGLTSSVDFMPMLVSLGDRGNTRWMGPELKQIYALRHDMVAMLKSKDAHGRSFVLHASDEIAPGYFNPTNQPTHVLGIRTPDYKFGVTANWLQASSTIDPSTSQYEFYDYSTEKGRMELANSPDDPRAAAALLALTNTIIPGELQEALPLPLRVVQVGAEIAHLVYRAYIEGQPPATWEAGGLRTILGYGADF
jgi:arylsulfatase A-like enzyme